MEISWFYADKGEAVGPLSLEELIAHLAKRDNALQILIWREGFIDWQPVEAVHEINQEILRRRPMLPPPIPAPIQIKQPVGDAAGIQLTQPALTGIGGWLVLIAVGLPLGLLKLIVSVGEYYAKQQDAAELFENFPTVAYTELGLNIGLIGFSLYSMILFFRKSRKFPRIFIAQYLIMIGFPFFSTLLLALIFAASTKKPVQDFIVFDEKVAPQTFAAIVSALIWIPYIIKSKRVANTFTR